MKKNEWKDFLNICCKIKKEKDFEEFFKLFLSCEERNSIALRYAIVKALLKKEKTQREIARELGTSIAKITRGSNELKATSKQLKEFILKQ